MKKIIPIFVPHQGCPHRCNFCHQEHITGVAIHTTLGSDELRRQIDRALQEPKSRRKEAQFDLAFYGGSFTGLALHKQEELLRTARDYIEQGRISEIRLSTHPAMFTDRILDLLQRYSVSLIELGVQSFDDRVLELAERQHTAAEAVQIINTLQTCGIQVGIHLMIGLLGDSDEKSLASTRKTIELKPASVRIHPCLVIRGTRLEKLYRDGKYRPLSLDAAVHLSKKMLMLFKQHNIPVTRIGLQPTESMERHIIDGPYHPAFRQLVESALFYDSMAAQAVNREVSGNTLLFQVSPQDLSTARGQKNTNIRKLMQAFQAHEVRILPDTSLARGEMTLLS
ncbi:MAG: radical SAM protein [bacterium]|nr:radical SAM protein [bacterium]